ncbi:MAG: hypothetical protein HQ515_22360 [Phycisphaeraceae bacterium]|nr:hypothetical protein [Phycisphaeraceae bacterium]
MSDLDIFVQIVQEAEDLPQILRTNADQATRVTASVLEKSFLSLLDTQIQQSSRGPQWVDKLKGRKEAMLPYCGQCLLKGRIDIGIDVYWLQVSPDANKVVYWELYEAYQERLS